MEKEEEDEERLLKTAIEEQREAFGMTLGTETEEEMPRDLEFHHRKKSKIAQQEGGKIGNPIIAYREKSKPFHTATERVEELLEEDEDKDADVKKKRCLRKREWT